MKPVKCPNCGNEIAVDESSQYLSCGSCGKCYVNPFYVKKESSNATAEQSNQVEQNEKPKGSWRCVSCKAILPSDDSSPTLICPACGRSHKNPSYKPTQSAVVQENVVQNINNAKSIINNEQTVTVQQSVINAPPKVGESKFTGTYGSLLGHRIVNSLISIFTLGFGIPWVICRSHRWEVEHTVIDGRHLSFDGTGGKLIGAWIKWMFLTLITCGIYGLWVPLKKRAWIVEHSHIEGLSGESKFTGGLGSYIGLQIVNALIMIFTLGLGLPWVVCRTIKWDSEHQIIDGQRIYFDGKASQLFGNWIKWVLLTVVTLGIYSILIPIKKQAWIVKHQSFVKPMENSGQSTGKQIDVNNQKKKDIGKIVGCVLAVVCVIATIVAVCVTVIPNATHQHSWVWIVDEEATAIETGLKHEECSVCHAKQNENTIIDALGFAGLAYSINNDGETCTITGIGNFTGSNVTIPEAIDGYTVTGIGDNAFCSCRNLTSVTIPNTVTEIGFDAFAGCTNIVEATIPAWAIGYIPKDNLQTVVITSGTTIGERAFYYCRSLTSVTIGDSVTRIGEDAFSHCTNLTSVTFGENSQLTTIGSYAFAYCDSLTNVTFGENSQLTTIEYHAFYYCSNLKSVTFGKNSRLTSIGMGAFVYCTSLTSIVIPDSVTTIGSSAFNNCDSLTSIVIPDSVTTIGSSAFEDCTRLADVYYTGTEAQWNRITIGSNNSPLTNATIHYNYVNE